MSGNEDVYRQAMQEGHSFAWDGKWEQAIAFYRQALSEFPDRPEALNSLGLALSEVNRTEEALKCYLQAARVSPNDPLPLEKVGELYERLGNQKLASTFFFQAGQLYSNRKELDKAIENLTRATYCDPDHLKAHLKLATILEYMRRDQQAVIEYLTAARLMQHSGKLDKAMQAVEHALAIIPNNKEAQQAYTLLKESKPIPKITLELPLQTWVRQPQPATSPTKTEQTSPPMDSIEEAYQKALAALAEVLLTQENEQTSMQEPPRRKGLQTIVRNVAVNLFTRQHEPEKITPLIAHFIDLHRRGEIPQAIQELEQALLLGFNLPAAYFILGKLLSDKEEANEALKHLRFTTEDPDYRIGANLLIGQLLMKSGNVNEATTAYLQALKWAEAETIPTHRAEELNQLYGKYIEAKAKSLDLENQKRLCESIDSLLIRSDWREHLIQLRRDLLIEREEGSLRTIAEPIIESSALKIIESIGTIRKLANNGKWRSAIEEAFYALQYAPTYLPLHLLIGELLFQQGHLQEAVEKFTVVAQSYIARGEWQQASELLIRTKTMAPMDRNIRTILIEALIASGKEDQAIKEYIELAEIHYHLADLEQARNVYKEALRLANKTNSDLSTRLDILHQIADIDIQNLDWKQALRVFEEMRNLQPDDEYIRTRIVEMHFRLSQINQALQEIEDYLALLSIKGKTDEGLRFLQKLVQEMPEQWVIRRKLGNLYAQMGNIKEAVAQLDYVGRKLLQVGNRAGAIDCVEAIIALNPPNKLEYQELLKRLRA